jgi:branched-chain amino acid transport system substrate-binding protein
VKSGKIRVAAVLGVAALLAAGCGSSSSKPSAVTTGGTSGSGGTTSSSPTSGGSSANTASAPGVSSSTINIGYITSVTGDASSTFADGPAAAEARIDAINAAGGIDGRKVKLIVADDQSTPAANATAAEDLVQNKKVFAVIDYSSFTFGGAPYLQKEGIPVVGYEFDGPEWAEQPYTNMFSFTPPVETPFDGKYYTYTYTGKFLKDIGVTKVGGLGYGISPSSQESIKAMFASAATDGITKCYENESVPFGGVDFTATALALKSSGCNGVVGSFVDSSDLALSGAVKNGGITAKQLYFTGYDQDVLATSAARSAFNGSYVQTPILFNPSIPGVATMFGNLKQYDSSYKAGTIPDFGAYGSYLAADLLITGLKDAGQNPTRASFIANLRKVTSYTAGGVLPSPTSFANFGTVASLPKTSCDYFVQLQGTKFVEATPGGKSICGSLVGFTFKS